MRGGSTANSHNLTGQANPDTPPASASVNPNNAPSESNRLSVENIATRLHRAPSVTSSNGRPVSVASSNSHLSTGSSVASVSGTSVCWDEDGLRPFASRGGGGVMDAEYLKVPLVTLRRKWTEDIKESRRSSGGR